MSNTDNYEEHQISLFDLIRTFWRGRRIIALITCMALIVSILFTAFLMTPEYRAKTTIIIMPPTVTPAPLLDRVTILDPFEGFADLTQDDLIYLVKSDRVIRETVNIMDLEISFSELSEAITVSKVPSTTFVEIAVLHFNPEHAVEIANTLVSVYQREIQDYYYQTHNEAYSLVSDQLDAAHQAVQDKKQELKVFAGEDIEDLNADLEAMERQYRSDKDRLTSIEVQKGIDEDFVHMLIETDLADSTIQAGAFDIYTNPNTSSSSQSSSFSQ